MESGQDETRSRRRFLATALGVGTVGLAGCSGVNPSGQTGDGDEDTANGGENGQDNRSEPSGNGQENGTENNTGNESNGQPNGGENGQPEDLLETVKILDGESQGLESLTLGDGDNATENAEIYIGIEGEQPARYMTQANTGVEAIAEALNAQGTVTPGKPDLMAQLNWENFNDIEEQVDTELQVTAQIPGEQETASIPITIQENGLDLEAMYKDNLAKRQEAIKNIPKTKNNYRNKFIDVENLIRIYDHYGIDIELVQATPLMNRFINNLDESTENLGPQDLSHKYKSSNPYEGAVVVRDFDTGLNPFETIFEGKIWKGMEDGRIIQYTGGEEFPQEFQDFLNGERPSIADETEGDEYIDWGFDETDYWNDNIILYHGLNLNGAIPGATSYEKYPIWSFPTIMLDPETGEFREKFFNSREGGENESVKWEVDPVHDYGLEPEQLERYQFAF